MHLLASRCAALFGSRGLHIFSVAQGDHRSDDEEWKQVRAQAEEHPAKHLYDAPVRLREVSSAKSEQRMLGHRLRQILRKVACEKKARDYNSELIEKGRVV